MLTHLLSRLVLACYLMGLRATIEINLCVCQTGTFEIGSNAVGRHSECGSVPWLGT